MKAIQIILLSLIFSNAFSQEILEKEVKTKVNEVTVFLDGAQVVRNKLVNLPQGETVLKFVDLSPFIDAKSVHVKAEGEITVLSVNHQRNFLYKLQKSEELTNLEQQLDKLDEEIKIGKTYLEIIKEELAFLKENRAIGGKNEQLSVANLQQASEFYSNKLTSLKLKEIERSKTIRELTEKKKNIQQQIKTLTSKKDYPVGEILVKVNTKKANRYAFVMTYMVENAGWFPSYDIRAKNINEPVRLVYKANVKQDTKVDWTNVKLKFSSANPNVSGVAPELKTYYLNYNTLPPTYKIASNSVSGKVMGSNREALPGANIQVEGTTIGTIADVDGNYSITIPNGSNQLTYSFIGYQSQTLPVSGSVMNVALEEDYTELEEVVVVGYGTQTTEALTGSVAGVSLESPIRIRGASSLSKKKRSIPVPTVQVENQTTVDFEITMPYSIKSDNKNYSVDMVDYNLPVFYQYYCVPKIDDDAFLIANIINWEKYNLLEGEANIFFEGTYVGKTLLDVRFASDTLAISLGRDKKVSVSREKIDDFTDKQFIGNKKEETRAWKTTVKNNKNQAINMFVIDQVPVSTNNDIEVKVQDVSGGKQNDETGEVKWNFNLEPGMQKDFNLKFSVKYPKYRNLMIE